MSGNIKTHDYYNHVITTPSNIKRFSNYTNIMVVNSENRNKYLFPNSNSYVVEVEETLGDIIEIELISLDYEYNRRLFDNTNNEIYITHEQDNITYSISIPQGYYNTTQQVVNNFNNVYNKNMETLTHSISLKYSELHKAFYFINLLNQNQNGEFKILYKGNEIAFPSNTYGSIINDTDVYAYKNNTDGSYLGFSQNDFSNKLNTLTLGIENLQNNIYHLTIGFLNENALKQLVNIINTADSDMVLNFVDFRNNIETGYSISYNNILKFKEIDNTTLKIEVSLTSALENNFIANPKIYTNMILGDLSYNLKRDISICLEINELDRIKSNNVNIDKSFAVIDAHSNKIIFDNTKAYGTIKYFNPPLKKLDRLTISFKDTKGNIIEHSGKENVITFAIKCINDKNNLG